MLLIVALALLIDLAFMAFIALACLTILRVDRILGCHCPVPNPKFPWNRCAHGECAWCDYMAEWAKGERRIGPYR